MNKKIKSKIENPSKVKKGFRAYCAIIITIALITALSAAAFAADDPYRRSQPISRTSSLA